MKNGVKYIRKNAKIFIRSRIMTRQETVEKIVRKYEGLFDIHPIDKDDLGLVCRCDFHVHNEKFVMVKKAKLWEADCHEYVFVFSVKSFTEEYFLKCKEYVISRGEELIDPKPGHMYTYLTAVFVCDNYTEQAVKLLKKLRYGKNYRFSLYGWSDLRAFMIKADDKTLFCNKNRKEFAKFIKNI